MGWLFGHRKQEELADAKAEARRWVERLGGQVLNLSGTDTASKQALADASERYNAAGSQLDQATTPKQAQLAIQSAYEGLYYVRAARQAMGLDPGPELPPLPDQQRAGRVTQDRQVDVQGRPMAASPNASGRTPYYYPGGDVAGRPVPAGWYSEPWWKTALVAGAWGVGSALLFDSLFSGMGGQPYEHGFGDGYEDGFEAGERHAEADNANDGNNENAFANDSANIADTDNLAGGDWGGGGGDWGGGGDFGGDDFGGGGDW